MQVPGTDSESEHRLRRVLSRSPVRREIVALLIEGRTRKQIAALMQRSPHTIDAHLKSIYRYIGCGDRGRLMLFAQRLLNQPPPPSLPPPPENGYFSD